MLYRPYIQEDFDELYAIEEACFQPPFRFARKFMRQLVESPIAATWIAEEETRMAGFAIADWGQDANRVIAYIQTIEVAPDWRGRGIGGELLRRIEGSAWVAGAQTIWLHVSTENAGAVRLYQRNGYLCKGVEKNYYARRHAALIYAKPMEAERAS